MKYAKKGYIFRYIYEKLHFAIIEKFVEVVQVLTASR
jgi:hypothetical protein